MKKRFLTMFLALALCLGLAVPAFATDNDAAVSGTCGKSTTWSFDKATGTLTISGTGSIDYLSGGKFTFYYPWEGFKQEIRSVSIEEGVTYIGMSAFETCANLTQVSIPQSVTGVGLSAFSGTPWLENQGEFAMINGILIKYQGGAEKVAIPEGVTSINHAAFAQDKTITELAIPEGVTSLGRSAFLGCDNLAQITFPSTLREVGADCFSYTRWLENQRTAGDFILAGPVLLKYQGKGGNVAIPDGVAYVEGAAFTWSSWFPFAEDLELDTLTVPTSMCDLNADLAFSGSTPKSVIYGGSREQWSMIENTAWHDGAQVPVYCADGEDLTYTFTDVPSWFEKEVAWAAQKGITNGYGGSTTFAPTIDCTQIQILTMLWRAEDRPTSDNTAFSDLAGDYAPAANWAYDQEIIDDSFHPDSPCTRAQAVQYIWQALGKQEAKTAASFSDVAADASYADAVSWAVEKGVTKGYGGSDTFAPDRVCNRGEIVAFLYRAYNN
ncbi:MAG: leucine-rich repeat protein [Clostridiales bacterium]|nr:leucine-rich repeat protein [Clostridiales bacterium]